MPRQFAALVLTISLWGQLAQADVPATDSPPTAVEALGRLRTTYETRFNSAAVYWGVSGALLATGGVTLGLSPIESPSPAGQLALVSGSATILSGVSSGFSALPLSLGPPILAERIARHGGTAALNEAISREILAEHAEWARNWRIACLVVTTTLLAVNATALTWYAVNQEYQRVTTAVVAGLYGLGVLVVPFYDMIPWVEETSYASLQAPTSNGAPIHSMRLLPGFSPSATGVAFALTLVGELR